VYQKVESITTRKIKGVLETLKLKSLTSTQINILKQRSVKQCSGKIVCTLGRKVYSNARR
jgi:hypothetical protein